MKWIGSFSLDVESSLFVCLLVDFIHMWGFSLCILYVRHLIYSKVIRLLTNGDSPHDSI